MCFSIGRNAILRFRKNMSQRQKGFQGNLDITIIKNSPNWFRNSLNVRDYCKTLHSSLTAHHPLELQSIKAKPKDRVPTDAKTHAVYSIQCSDCEKVYLSQTKRQFRIRLKEHQRAVCNSNSSKSALAEDVCETSHNIAWDDSRIITTNNRYGQRLCLEAWHINVIPCALNRDDGSYLPQQYLHLVGR